MRDYEAARNAARRLRISEPADAAQRTIAELLARIEKLEGKLVEDRSAVLAVYDAVPKPGVSSGNVLRATSSCTVQDGRARSMSESGKALWRPMCIRSSAT